MNETLKKFKEINVSLIAVMKKIKKVKLIMASQQEGLLLPSVADYREQYLQGLESYRRQLIDEQFHLADEIDIDHVRSVLIE